MKGKIQTSDGILGGKQSTFNIDLTKGPIEGNLVVDGLGFSKASVEVVCTNDIGTGGIAPIQQRNRVNGPGGALATPSTVAFTAGGMTSTFDLVFTGRYLVIDITSITFATQGKVNVVVILKL